MAILFSIDSKFYYKIPHNVLSLLPLCHPLLRSRSETIIRKKSAHLTGIL